MDELQIEERPIGIFGLGELEGTEERLAHLLNQNELIRHLEDRSSEHMTDPIAQDRAFALFGLSLGAFGPFSIGFNWLLTSGAPSGDELAYEVGARL